MLNLYVIDSGEPKQLDSKKLREALWIDATAPSPEEVECLHKTFGIQLQDLADCLDPNERSRVEIDEDYDMLVLRALISSSSNGEGAQTMPVGIFMINERIITVRLAPTFTGKDLTSDIKRKAKMLNREDLFLAIIRRITRDIDKRVRPIEGQISTIQKSIFSGKKEVAKNAYSLSSELILLNTSLLSNFNAVSMLSRAKHIKLSEEQNDVLEDLENDVAQLYDMTTIYREIVSNVLRAHESVISNNLSSVMKILASISLILMLPTLIASLYGMNIDLPFQDHPLAFWIVITVTAIAVAFLWLIFRVKKML